MRSFSLSQKISKKPRQLSTAERFLGKLASISAELYDSFKEGIEAPVAFVAHLQHQQAYLDKNDPQLIGSTRVFELASQSLGQNNNRRIQNSLKTSSPIFNFIEKAAHKAAYGAGTLVIPAMGVGLCAVATAEVCALLNK